LKSESERLTWNSCRIL